MVDTQAETSELPVSNIKEYIVKSRQAGYPDSKILESLKKANWPDDVIESAVVQANEIIAPVAEIILQAAALPTLPEQESEVKKKPEELKKELKDAEAPTNLQHLAAIETAPKKKFSFLSII